MPLRGERASEVLSEVSSSAMAWSRDEAMMSKGENRPEGMKAPYVTAGVYDKDVGAVSGEVQKHAPSSAVACS